MRRRSKARECALQVLYQLELTQAEPRKALDEFWEDASEPDDEDASGDEPGDVKSFTADIVGKIAGKLTDIDLEIEKSAENWKMSRMALVDRNILRIGVCEILYFSDIPSKVAINEAIELAKKFGDAESPRFVNGILDRVARNHRPCD